MFYSYAVTLKHWINNTIFIKAVLFTFYVYLYKFILATYICVTFVLIIVI